MVWIDFGYGKWIVKNCLRFGKTNGMLAQIGLCFLNIPSNIQDPVWFFHLLTSHPHREGARAGLVVFVGRALAAQLEAVEAAL